MYRYFLLITLVLLSGISLTTAQSDSPSPYLYYYSRLYGGLIVERADGTDSRLIGADAIPPGMSGIGGAGWSPSGRFFAAYAVQYDSYSRGGVYLMNSDGTGKLTALSHIASVQDIEWLSGDDELLFIQGGYYPGLNYLGVFFWIVEPSSHRILAEFGASWGCQVMG